MEWLEGKPLARRGEPAPRNHIREAAFLLADLHSAGTRHRKTRDVEAILRSLERKCLDVGKSSIGDLARRVLDELALRLPEDHEFVPSHGDFSPRNLILTSAGLRLIDFDRIQLADPARDVAYYGAWSWVTGLLFDGRPDWSIGDEFTVEYLARRPDARLSPQLTFHKVAALVRIVHGWTVLRNDPDSAQPVLTEALRILDS
jgi:aminoglycoside phosphotransferase